ncbi:UDP-N-acetylmuramyl peptide synthase [Limnochorda pilosa]|uniref:UDP-N-acetylmuramoyl-L-alanyl-D-glutamate--2,6-diaminopimelate ligase n=1 Tax=Limnochorda pilosa TaxID=1555112 RepID=A0A0K2SKS8_LIMPI|nr:UDP-N-acetylmuramoyl-L-alanyl-D-glutamate--2,6-diaminopimelate ligase [Limnochorda pilosa]BAS27711.1 UDP-N-acetylmuramyl peptide synthase [Limnochorda pilosa]
MKLSALVEGLPGAQRIGAGDPEVRRVRYHSQQVAAGDLFVCVRGFRHDGHRFAGEAVERGAVALLVEEPLALPVPQVKVPGTREAMGRVAARLLGDPSRKLRVVGVTGTNGKTTTTHLIKACLEAGGVRTGLIGTIHHLVGESELLAQRTTPEAPDLLELMGEMLRRGAGAVVMEVSSHALTLHRTEGCEIDVGVLTNVTQDHLDFHPTFDEYVQAKARLFRLLTEDAVKSGKLAVLNREDPHWEVMRDATRAPVTLYGLGAPADVRAEDVRLLPDGSTFTLVTPLGQAPVRLRLPARYNVANALAAAAACLGSGVALQAVVRGLESVPGVPGRLERVDEGQPFGVLVDYAHTPDSLENVLTAVRAFTPGRVIVVFGCGGDRDRGKRPLMGEAAARLADHVVITSDNPRSEDPEAICREVAAGADEARRDGGRAGYEVLVDRRAAIRRAVEMARQGDQVVIAGKGHETYQIFADRTLPFDDREEARKALRDLESEHRA